LDYDQTDPSADREGGGVVPAFGHADTVVRPRPAPSEVRTTADATAATVPAETAANLQPRSAMLAYGPGPTCRRKVIGER
jgi:hypothetical protein